MQRPPSKQLILYGTSRQQHYKLGILTVVEFTAIGAVFVFVGSTVQMLQAMRQQDSFYRNQKALQDTYKAETRNYHWWNLLKTFKARREVRKVLGDTFQEFKATSSQMTWFGFGWASITVGSAVVAFDAVVQGLSRLFEIS